MPVYEGTATVAVAAPGWMVLMEKGGAGRGAKVYG